ncbi:MAG: DUF4861 family protein [Wenyingzhuangia sp.]|uniref:DUF4861 family protein n=1 Tax=Wenyingzhuangia sp. TaxID=1964193 RepID=UPI003219A3E5
MRTFKLTGIASSLLALLLLISCEKKAINVTVTNSISLDRAFETVSIPLASLPKTDEQPVVTDTDSGKTVVTQLADTNHDGETDALLFQPSIKGNSKKVYEITFSSNTKAQEENPSCYSRFVPERTDDYAWENNRVAFRTYGPTAQKMIEDGIKGGTLSSGIDAWLKRVDYPIINKWYKKELETHGSYHKDDGEGLDNFHVGISRGVGGIAKKVGENYYISKNFTSYKTHNIGPIRTDFVLTYADWDANGTLITEVKNISLDYGSNLAKFEISLKGVDTISTGLTLHEKDGETGVNQEKGWISYWEPHADSELGTGIVVHNDAMVGYENYQTDKKDESNMYVHLEIKNEKVVYYTGFGWKKSGQFTSKIEWENYLDQFSEKLKNPLEVRLN